MYVNLLNVSLANCVPWLLRLKSPTLQKPVLTHNPPHHHKQLQVDLASQRRDSDAHKEMLKPPEQWKG